MAGEFDNPESYIELAMSRIIELEVRIRKLEEKSYSLEGRLNALNSLRQRDASYREGPENRTRHE